MTREQTCAHEHAVTSAVLSRRWPHGCDEVLQQHAEACQVCREVVAIATLLREDQAEPDLRLPAAGQIWWRSALRARSEAARAAARPMIWLQSVAAAVVFGLALAVGSVFWPPVREATLAALPDVVSSMKGALPLLAALFACVLVGPVAYYLAVPRD